MANSILSYNYNSNAAGLYIDGHWDVVDLSVNLTNLVLNNNYARIIGGALYFGTGILNLKAIFVNITCSNNTAGTRIFFHYFHFFSSFFIIFHFFSLFSFFFIIFHFFISLFKNY